MTAPRNTLRDATALVAAGIIPASDRVALAAVAERYAVAVTPTMADLIQDDVVGDPIARQFVPSTAELHSTPQERADPIGDGVHEKVPGLIHRYPDRVLLKVTHACPVYCRFCFRREMVGPGGDQLFTAAKRAAALAYIASDPGIFEVILTGGDPLVLSPRRIEELTKQLAAIPHVQVVRWHTRVPIVDPARISDTMVAALRAAGGKAVYVAIHANHAREFTPAARAAVARLVDAGIVLISQTVLLKGVNDNAETLAELMRTFVSLRVKPYYLHHPDRAPGTSHFRLSVTEGRAIVAALRGRLSGLAQPTYVLDIPGGVAKVPIGPTYVEEDGVRDPAGAIHPFDMTAP